jgi:hypothetical protein
MKIYQLATPELGRHRRFKDLFIRPERIRFLGHRPLDFTSTLKKERKKELIFSQSSEYVLKQEQPLA